jgi:hypothetical protein
MAESSPSNSPNQSRRQSNDNELVSPVSPVLPGTNTHSILSHLLKKDDYERQPLLKRHKSKDYNATNIDNNTTSSHDPELGNHMKTPSQKKQQYQQQQYNRIDDEDMNDDADYHNTNKTKEFRPTWSQFRNKLLNPKNWVECFTQPIKYIPAVILGLLLNLLDAISYGMITFPLNNPIFASFGPDGISMFFVR